MRYVPASRYTIVRAVISAIAKTVLCAPYKVPFGCLASMANRALGLIAKCKSCARCVFFLCALLIFTTYL
jgi:hypothetical protein